MFGMFWAASSVNRDISQWDVSKVTNMGQMFNSASAFNSDISQWDVSSVTNMRDMFGMASSFNCDISQWDVSRVNNMNTMFYAAKSFKQTLCVDAWVTSTADKYGMFKDSPGQICEGKESPPREYAPESNAELRDSVIECTREKSRSQYGPL